MKTMKAMIKKMVFTGKHKHIHTHTHLEKGGNKQRYFFFCSFL
jgi:hypothetical protein